MFEYNFIKNVCNGLIDMSNLLTYCHQLIGAMSQATTWTNIVWVRGRHIASIGLDYLILREQTSLVFFWL